MKKELTLREKVLMGILVILMLVCAYYYAFYLPSMDRIAALQIESTSLKEQIAIVDAEVSKMEKMKAELDEIMANGTGEVKELPAYDNGKNVMDSLSDILKSAGYYSVNFSSVEIEDNTVRRNINLTYNAKNYDTAKKIFTQIYESDYRCLIKDVIVSNAEGSYGVTLDITYFEYK